MQWNISFKKDYWNPVSDKAKEFIDHTLVLDPKVPFNAAKLGSTKTQMVCTSNLDSKIVHIHQRLCHIQPRTVLMHKKNLSLKRHTLKLTTHWSSTAEIINQHKAFDQFDSGNDGVIFSQELKVALQDKCSYTNG